MSLMEDYSKIKDSKFSEMKRVAEYLMSRDDLAESVNKKNKSLEKCWAYIMKEAKKMASSKGCLFVDDETVYGWAVHYYDEDEADVELAPSSTTTTEPINYKKQSVLSVSKDMFKFIGDEFTLVDITNSDGEIISESSDPSKVEVKGNVAKAIAKGKVIITVHTKGTDNFFESEKKKIRVWVRAEEQLSLF